MKNIHKIQDTRLGGDHEIGAKRLVVGATHYGLRDWLVQRITAVIMALYTVIVLGLFLLSENIDAISYPDWVGLFNNDWFKFATFLMIIALLFHAWVGVRDIWMDYIKPVGLRLALQSFTILWLVACAGWAIQILWGIQP